MVHASLTDGRSRPSRGVPLPTCLLGGPGPGRGQRPHVVSAPPGYGKTLLLADWVRRVDAPVAWVSLDEEDDDPRRLS